MKLTSTCKKCGEIFSMASDNTDALVRAYGQWEDKHSHAVFPQTREVPGKPAKK